MIALFSFQNFLTAHPLHYTMKPAEMQNIFFETEVFFYD